MTASDTTQTIGALVGLLFGAWLLYRRRELGIRGFDRWGGGTPGQWSVVFAIAGILMSGVSVLRFAVWLFR